MAKKRLIVDMDGTLARFHDEVDYIERMFEQGFFESLAPFEKMVEAIHLFIQNHPDVPVFVCSAAVQSPYCIDEKNAWLDRYLPEISKENRFYPDIGRPKAEYIPGGVTKDDYLLDDYNRSLHQFMFDGGSAIKCHNNINQKGMGTLGGDRGYMWEGPMVHADDAPEVIAAELAQLMGLEHCIEKAAKAYHVQYVEDEEKSQIQKESSKKVQSLIREQNGYAVKYALSSLDESGWKIYFQNPFNALRWQNNDQSAYEYTLRTYEGEELTVSGYQLKAICQNAYGNSDFKQYMRADRAQLAEDVKRALSHRNDAVVGFVCDVAPDGYEADLTPYYDHESMARRIEKCERTGQGYRAEWFIEPPAPEHKQIKEETRPSFDSALEAAKRRASEAQGGGSPGDRSQHVYFTGKQQ